MNNEILTGIAAKTFLLGFSFIILVVLLLLAYVLFRNIFDILMTFWFLWMPIGVLYFFADAGFEWGMIALIVCAVIVIIHYWRRKKKG